MPNYVLDKKNRSTNILWADVLEMFEFSPVAFSLGSTFLKLSRILKKKIRLYIFTLLSHDESKKRETFKFIKEMLKIYW